MICAEVWTVLERHFEGVNWGDPAESIDVIASDFTWHSMPERETYHCSAGYLAYLRRWRKAFPDCWWELTGIHGGAESVICQSTFRGVHQGLLETPVGFVTPPQAIGSISRRAKCFRCVLGALPASKHTTTWLPWCANWGRRWAGTCGRLIYCR